ncbi:hypothetical protein [Collinsella sp. An2]|uniref:hypothetical protein n=1 Tax=Collinsella sp. An2 TaxID=1965585 RepID=UPI000B382BA9|nr:hypothetical protein [Collinsella sp. An2]OUP06395.1 hypothetical protein B5F33_10155 [Collinsella sp. An2]
MSRAQKQLKALSIVMVLLGVFFVAFTLVHFAFAANDPAVVLLALAALLTFFDIMLSVMGIGAANVPVRAGKILPILLVALLVNLAAAIYYLSLPGTWPPVVVNAVVTSLFAGAARAVYREALQ